MRTRNDLWQMQQLPLEIKVRLSEARIRQWVQEFGEDGVYVSFSGGKDSTVVSHLVDRVFPGNQIQRIFVNTGLEYPEIVEFVKKEPRARLIRPALNFKQVIQKYGYPVANKEVSKRIHEYRAAVAKGKDVTQTSAYKEFNGLQTFQGRVEICDSEYNKTNWKFLLDAPFKISNRCCDVMKKAPLHHVDGLKPITGQLAEESRARQKNWVQHGGNAFDSKNPISNPIAFWKEQDVLQYIKENNIQIASVYGEIIPDISNERVSDGQMRIEEFIGGCTCKLKTSGCARTGCMFCGYGAHRDKPGEGRFLKMKESHPKIYEWIMKPTDIGGLGFKEVIDWMNEHGGLHIEY